VNACRRVAAWADGRGALRTSLEFSQAAALVSPDSAALAYAVGRVARRLADYDRAESWYTRAVVQARESREWRSYASALAGMGNLHMQRGNYPAARRAHLRCLHAAERYHVPELVGAAYHNLFSIAIEMRAGAEADELAASALAAYKPCDAAVLRLAIDVAYHWNLTGNFAGALQVALALEPAVDDPSLRPSVQSLIARAAGGVGDRTRYDAAVSRIDDLLSDPAIPEEMAARALLGLAHGALNLGDRPAAASRSRSSACGTGSRIGVRRGPAPDRGREVAAHHGSAAAAGRADRARALRIPSARGGVIRSVAAAHRATVPRRRVRDIPVAHGRVRSAMGALGGSGALGAGDDAGKNEHGQNGKPNLHRNFL